MCSGECNSQGYQPRPTPLERISKELATAENIIADLDKRCFRLENLANTGMEARERITKHADRIEQRLEKMEKAQLANFIYIKDDGKAVVDTSMIPFFDVIVQSSPAFRNLEKALSEEMAKTREMDDILAGVVKHVGYMSEAPEDDHVERWCIGDPRHPVSRWEFDTKASPKDIPFSVALEYLKAGRRICRSQWELGACAVIRPGKGIVYECTTYAERFKPENNDMLSTDWMVIPEKP